jgi:hypothetical protein
LNYENNYQLSINQNRVMAKQNGMRSEYQALSQMTYRDLKIACIGLGMEFNDIVEGDHTTLSSFFIKNYYTIKQPELLEYFDVWMDNQLEARGYPLGDPIRAYRLSSVLDPETDDVKIQRSKVSKGIRLPKKVAVKRERNKDFNILTGTKKEYTMELTKKLLEMGKNLSSKKLQTKLVENVVTKYPDANPKSIMIWVKRVMNGYTGTK